MIIQCPECATKYSVGSNAIGAQGRTVRCTSCGNSWFQERADDPESILTLPDLAEETRPDVAEEPAVERADAAFAEEHGQDDHLPENTTPILTAERDKPVRPVHALPAPAQSLKTLWPTLAALAAAGLIVATPLLVLHRQIETAWPPSSRVYHLAGLSQSLPAANLELHDVHAALRTEDGAKTLTIDGLIRNPDKDKVTVPNLRATLLRDGKTVKTWDFASGLTAIGHKDPSRFSATLDGADATGGNVLLTFASENGAVQAR